MEQERNRNKMEENLLQKIQQDLKQTLSQKRYLHSIGTMKLAEKLAKQYHVNPEEAVLTGLAHDMAKELPKEERIKYIEENHIPIDEIEEKNTGLLHGKIGAHMAKTKYGFSESMQKAIAYHTTGSPDMDTLAKIIFIADKAEETRDYEDIEIVRKLAKKDLDQCILYILDFTIKQNIDKKKLVHPNSILTRNKILLQINNSMNTLHNT